MGSGGGGSRWEKLNGFIKPIKPKLQWSKYMPEWKSAWMIILPHLQSSDEFLEWVRRNFLSYWQQVSTGLKHVAKESQRDQLLLVVPIMSHPQVTFRHTTFTPGSFLARRRETVSSVTLLYQLDVLKTTGRYDAFKLKWNPRYNEPPLVWPVPNHLFWDSDVAKWIEGACYFLEENHNEAIDLAVTELVDMIRSAQQQDGYLNIHFTVVQPGKRFTNLRDLHELYNAGHLIEAALAHNHCYGNEQLLWPILAYVDLLCRTFGPAKGQKHGYPGHPEIELALLRLHARTRKPEVLALARYFLEERGNPHGCNGKHYYDVEAKERGDCENDVPDFYPKKRSYWYHQAHLPILQQQTIEGHSVRAVYLLTAVADLVRTDGLLTTPYNDALHRLWDNMVNKKMYLTGGIGAMKQWEGFGIDYFLPQGTDEGGCYGETCAAIGVIMLAERMLQIDLDGKYADILELCLFNAVLTGMSLDGKSFTYVNQLASSDSDPSKREDWFTVSCCPPNITRLLGYVGGCVWSFAEIEDVENPESLPRPRPAIINVHLYTSATLTFSVGNEPVKLVQESEWPNDGRVNFSLSASSKVEVAVRLRIPAWVGASTWELSPMPPDPLIKKGYLKLSANWLKENPHFTFTIPMKPRLISPHPFTNQDIVALARGPLIYCLEDVDNGWVPDHFKSLLFDTSGQLTEHRIPVGKSTAEPCEYVGIEAKNAAYLLDLANLKRMAPSIPQLPVTATSKSAQCSDAVLNFIPYYLRANRGGKGHMRVGLHRYVRDDSKIVDKPLGMSNGLQAV